jgi:hypothetical protein
LTKVRYMFNEIGGGTTPTIIENQFECQLDLSYYGMGWDKCQQTDYQGPCWQKKNMTVEEWKEWVNSQKR